MAVTKQTYTANGNTTQFSIPFEYTAKADVDVYINGVLQLQQNTSSTAQQTHPQVISGEITQGTALINYTFADDTNIEFNSAPANGAFLFIERTTDDTSIVTFTPGSTIRAQELNSALEQVRFIAQEGSNTARDGVTPSKENSLSIDARGLRLENLADANTDDDAVNRGQLSKVLTEDLIAGDAITLTEATGGTNSGKQVTVSIDDGTLDISKFKADDIVTLAEQNAGSPSWVGLDDALATVGALEKRYDVIYQNSTPSGTDYQVGKLWYAHGNDQTLSVWSGNNWIGIVSGGTFISQPTVIWVDQANGDDTNDGHRIIDSMKTIKAAVASADSGDIVLVAPGVYREVAPIDITVNNLSIVGQSLRSCFVHPTPATEEETMFRVNSGTQIANFSIAGMKASGTRGGHAVDSDSTYGLPENQGWAIAFYPNAVIYKSPYIQNCTTFMDSGIYNHTEAEYNANNALGGFFDPNNVNQGGFGGDRTSDMTGGGMFIDGNAVSSTSPLRSMVVDSFTQINLNGPGALVCNNAYAQFVSFFGTFCHYHCKSLNGGRVNLSNCTTDYGLYGLIGDGKSSSAIYSSTAQAAASAGAFYVDINVATAPAGWFGSGTHATRPTDDMMMEIGSDLYALTGTETLGPDANPTGYRVNVIRTSSSNRSINLGLNNAVAQGATVSFYFRSYISSGGHTFEYVGAGTDYDAAPENGGQPVEANRVIELNNGAVWQSSTDHNGKFSVGTFMVVDQKSGLCTINNVNGLAFPTSDGNTNQVLSTNGSGTLSWQSISNLGGGGITNVNEDTSPELGGQLDAQTYKIVNLGTPTAAADAATKGYVDGLSFANYSDTTANFTGTLQNGGSDVVVDTDIGSTVQAFDADTAKTDVAQTYTAGQRGEITTLTSSSGVLAIDFNASNNFYIELSENLSSITATNPAVGQSGSIFIKQPASGGPYTVGGWAAAYLFSGGTAPTITATNGKCDRVDYVIRSATEIQVVWTGNY